MLKKESPLFNSGLSQKSQSPLMAAYWQAGQTSIHNCSWREQPLLQAAICNVVPVHWLSHAWNRSWQVWQQS
jgi:hypothetical protein